MTGSLVISLDFELMWGVRDHRSVQSYGDAVLGGRKAIPEMLSRFKQADIKATWATVGLLFAKNRREMLEYSPTLLPEYQNANLSPYHDIEKGLIGEDETSDPYHFGASLIDLIAETPGQEVATHTYSHFYCMEPGATVAAFDQDLAAAQAIAAQCGHDLKSIVFPRNQAAGEYITAGAKQGLTVFRGEAKGWLYRPRAGQETTMPFRLARFLDGALPIGPNQIVTPNQHADILDVPASRFLRPWSQRLAPYHALHIRRIEKEMELAAKKGGCYHLWWHPHNFGRNLAENLGQLDRIIATFKRCRDEFGMESRNMKDVSGTL